MKSICLMVQRIRPKKSIQPRTTCRAEYGQAKSHFKLFNYEKFDTLRALDLNKKLWS
jgi:hypothetical protein